MPFEKLVFERIGRITITIEPSAEPVPEPTYSTITIIAPLGKGKTIPDGVISYKTGDTVTILAEPDPEWLFSEWRLNWVDIPIKENPLILHF